MLYFNWKKGGVMKQAMFLKIIFLSLISLALLFSVNGYCQPLSKSVTLIDNPVQLANWFSQDFKYETEMPDYWQSPEETIAVGKGDCEDFAILAQAVLIRMGIKAELLIIKFKGLEQSHAACVFKEGNFYSFVSNQTLVRTHATSLQEAIQEQYPDWEKLVFTTAKKQTLKTLVRSKDIPSQANELDTASRNK